MQINLKNEFDQRQFSKSKEHFPLTDSGSLYIGLLHKKNAYLWMSANLVLKN